MNPTPVTKPPVVVGGLQPLTTIDFPGQLAAVIFLQGCAWKCRYCHNADLIPRQPEQSLDWQDIIHFLQSRQGFLDAVVFSGGEPCLHKGLAEAIEQVRELGYKIGLHSAGIYPNRLKQILPLLDWIGLDIKAAKKDYSSITQVNQSAERAWESAKLVINSGIDYEVRTTVHDQLLNLGQLDNLRQELQHLGVDNFVIQQCNTQRCLETISPSSNSPSTNPQALQQLGAGFKQFQIRIS